jgi:hypothetical protein
VVLGVGGLGWARPAADTQKQEAAARKQVEQAVKELEAGRLPEAREHLQQAYVRAQLPEILFHLGRLAEQQREEVTAADLYRRYLAALPDGTHPELRSRLPELVARVRDKASELDVLSEDLGALLSLDGRVVGALPLAAPLIVATGPHRFQVVKGSQQFETNLLSIPSGQHLQLQLAVASRYAVLTLSSGIALLIGPGDTSAVIKAQLEKVVSTVAPESSCFLIDREPTSAAVSRLAPGLRETCAQQLDCQEQLARLLDASFVLSLTLHPSAVAPTKLEGKLFDVGTGMLVGAAETANPAATSEELPKLAAKLVLELLNESVNRGRGTLQVTSEPAGARVVIAGRELGRTPFSREAFEGPLEVSLELEGYEPYKTAVSVGRAEPTRIVATLQRSRPQEQASPPLVLTPIPPPPAPSHRPRWRLIVGGATLGAGLLLGGFGISALAVSGQCIDPAVMPAQLCDYAFGTRGVGGGLLGAGLALTTGGVLLMAWPGR